MRCATSRRHVTHTTPRPRRKGRRCAAGSRPPSNAARDVRLGGVRPAHDRPSAAQRTKCTRSTAYSSSRPWQVWHASKFMNDWVAMCALAGVESWQLPHTTLHDLVGVPVACGWIRAAGSRHAVLLDLEDPHPPPRRGARRLGHVAARRARRARARAESGDAVPCARADGALRMAAADRRRAARAGPAGVPHHAEGAVALAPAPRRSRRAVPRGRW